MFATWVVYIFCIFASIVQFLLWPGKYKFYFLIFNNVNYEIQGQQYMQCMRRFHVFALKCTAMPASFGEFCHSSIFIFFLCLFYAQLQQCVFHMWSDPRVCGKKPTLKLPLTQGDSSNKHLSSSVLCVPVYFCALEGSYYRWGRFPKSFNTVEAGAQRLKGVPALELKATPFPLAHLFPTREDVLATSGGVWGHNENTPGAVTNAYKPVQVQTLALFFSSIRTGKKKV